KSACNIQVPSCGAKVSVVILLDVSNGGLVDAFRSRENRTVRMISVQNFAEAFQRHTLWNRLRNGKLSQRIVLQPRQLRFGEQRMLRNIGQQRSSLWTEFAQHVSVEIGFVDTNG